MIIVALLQDEVAELGDALRAKDATIADLYKVKQRLEYEKEELHNVIADLEEKFKLETDKVGTMMRNWQYF